MPDHLGEGRTDLVAEMQQRSHAEQQAEHTRRLKAQQAEQARRSKMRRRSVLSSIAVVVVVLALAGIGKLAFDAYRVSSALDAAQEQVLDGTPEALTLAVTSLERGLEIDDDDSETRALLALVLAQQAIDGGATLDSAEAAIAEAEESTETTVAKAIAAILRGNHDEAATAVTSLEPSGPNAAALRRAVAWVQAQSALSDLDDPGALATAITAVDAAVAEAPGWDRNHRAAAALYFGVGRIDDAFTRIEEGRALRPADTGLLVDQILYDAVLQRNLGSVDKMASTLLSGAAPLSERDTARTRLAEAIAQLHREGDDDARSDLDEAYRGLAVGDRRARAIALEVALGSGATALAKAWVGDEFPPTSAQVHRAWIDFIEDDVAGSLKQLAALPQSHPRVALVQGLALVEQGRFEEARTQLDRAQQSFPKRPLIEVAMARIDAQLGDPSEAAERLEKLSSAYPRAPRVWTGLAESLTRAAKDGRIPQKAEKPLEQALEREAAPAQAAYMLGRRRQASSVDEPKLVPKALKLLRRAVELRDWVPAHRETLGLFLAEVGDRDEARELLQGTVDAPTTKPTSLLLLAELAAEDAAARKVVPPSEIATWLALAAQRGASVPAQTYTKARIALMAGTAEGVAQARIWIGPLLQADRKDLEARLLYVEILRREGAFKDARASIQTGIRKTPDRLEGRLHLALGQIEYDAGKERQAASQAYKGWRMVVKEPRPANELLQMAEQGIEWWTAVGNGSGARSIGLGLTRRVPYRAEAWVLRSKAQLEDDADKACQSADKAISLDDTLVDAHLALAECKLDSRQRKAAIAALKKAAELTKDEGQAKALRRRIRKLK